MVLSGSHQWLGLAVPSVCGVGWAVGDEAGQVNMVYMTEGLGSLSLRPFGLSNESEREGLCVRKLILAAARRMAGGSLG